jgi:hypothetical protein
VWLLSPLRGSKQFLRGDREPRADARGYILSPLRGFSPVNMLTIYPQPALYRFR